MPDHYFKAEITLSEMTEIPQDSGWPRTNTDTVARVEVTADSPGDAMRQISEHVHALEAWHAEVKADARV